MWCEFGILEYKAIDRNGPGLAASAVPWENDGNDKNTTVHSERMALKAVFGCTSTNFAFYTKDEPV